MPELAAWDSFYVIVGSAAGALIGLQFVDSVLDQLRRIFRNQVNVWPKIAAIDREVLAFNETAAWQLVEEGQ